MPAGRPTKYSKKIAQEICNEIATCDKGLFYICSHNPNFPSRETVYKWIRENDEFSHMYKQAKMDQADFMAEQIIEIADNSCNDTLVNRAGEEIENREWTNRSKLRVETRKWLAARFYPRVYGDRVQNDVNAKVEAKVDAKVTTNDESRRNLLAKLTKNAAENEDSTSNS